MDDTMAHWREARHEAREARELRKQRLAEAYAATFGSDSGQMVLEDLQQLFPSDLPRFTTGIDTHMAAVRDGQASVTKHILDAVATAQKLATEPPLKTNPTNIQ